MGLDVGERRVGVAVTDEFRMIASPVATVARGAREVETLRELALQYDIEGIVSGLPRGMSGREGPQARDVREFAGSIAGELGLSLQYWDERLTTAQAERSLIESGRNRAQRKGLVDAVAAALMLQNFIDSRLTTGGARRRR